MTAALQSQLDARLAETSVPLDRFRQLVGRLYASGVLYRPWSDEESRLYDDAARVEAILADYFALAGFHLAHDRDARVFRLFPPGAVNAESDEQSVEVTKRLRARVSREFAAALLTLRFLYGKAVQEGNVGPRDEVAITPEELAQAMASALGFTLSRSLADRQSLLRDLRMHRVVRLPEESQIASPDSFIAIQRSILSLVSEGVLESALAEQILEPVSPAAHEVPDVGETGVANGADQASES